MGGCATGPTSLRQQCSDDLGSTTSENLKSVSPATMLMSAEVVQALWARAGERLPCLGQRQGAEKRGPGQKPRPLRVKPPGGGVVLARGTVARRAGRGAVREGLARCARGDR